MSGLPTVHYKGLTLRPALPMDNELALQWCAADPFHAWETAQPFYWVVQKPDVLSCVMEDRMGIVFFLQLVTLNPEEMLLNIQFAPKDERGMRLRTIQAMTVGFEGLTKNLSGRGFKAVYFASESERVIQLATKRLGFVRDGERYRFDLERKSA